MNEILHYRSVYFLGIGGIGMSAIARFFLHHGIRVSGYDRTATALTRQLENEGMEIHFRDDPALIPQDIELVVYTPAVSSEIQEFRHLSRLGLPMKKRAEVLGMITAAGKTIATAGTHGKTTTTTLIAHILKASGISINGFLGGISKNHNTNFIGMPGHPGSGNNATLLPDYFVAEADEFDRSFLNLTPFIGIITSMDADHMDIYGNIDRMYDSFRAFTRQIIPGGFLIVNRNIKDLIPSFSGIPMLTYSVDEKSDYFSRNISLEDGYYRFDLMTPDRIIQDLKPGTPGRFNLENAVAACAVADLLRIPDEQVREALGTFAGVERRFDFRIKRKDLIYIDDYAHHPDEISACLLAVREIYPGKHITVVFQPHLFSRTRDLADGFASSLGLADSVLLMEIYPARENPIEGINASFLLDKIEVMDKHIIGRDNIADELSSRNIEVLLTLGAGDIDQLAGPITEMLDNR